MLHPNGKRARHHELYHLLYVRNIATLFTGQLNYIILMKYLRTIPAASVVNKILISPFLNLSMMILFECLLRREW
jgi:hypothetical protein